MHNSARHAPGNEPGGISDGARRAIVVYALWGLFMAGWISGCGYQFTVAGPGPTIGGPVAEGKLGPSQVPSPRLAIQTFDNASFEPTLAFTYTEYFRREFSAGSGATVVSGTESAELVLRGRIEAVSIPSLTFTTTSTFESRAIVTVNVTVQDFHTNRVVWEQRAAGSAEFFVTEFLQSNRVLQERAVEQAGEQVAGELASRFLAYLESTAPAPSPSAPSTSTDPAGSDDPMRRP